MAQCVAIVTVAGQDVLAPVADDPCTTMVVVSPAEYGALSQNPFLLDAEDGMVWAVAIVGIWSAAYAWRAAMRALGGGSGSQEA